MCSCRSKQLRGTKPGAVTPRTPVSGTRSKPLCPAGASLRLDLAVSSSWVCPSISKHWQEEARGHYALRHGADLDLGPQALSSRPGL